MIVIANFETDFKGRLFKDKLVESQSNLTCIGYGDNGDNGNPYFLGMYVNTATGAVGFKTVLMKNTEFVSPAT